MARRRRRDVIDLYVNMNPIRAELALTPEEAKHTSTHARLRDRLVGDAERTRSGWLAAVHVDGDGYDGVAAGRRASDKGALGISFLEYLELQDASARLAKAVAAGDRRGQIRLSSQVTVHLPSIFYSTLVEPRRSARGGRKRARFDPKTA